MQMFMRIFAAAGLETYFAHIFTYTVPSSPRILASSAGLVAGLTNSVAHFPALGPASMR